MAEPAITGDAGPPPTPIGSPAELVQLLRSDARFRFFQVLGEGEHFVEVGVTDGGVVLAWPDLWKNRAALAPHLVRARSGYTPIVILGTDAEFAAHSVDLLREEGDLFAVTLPLGIERLALLVHHYRSVCRLRRDAAEGELQSDRYRYERAELNDIAIALSLERDIDKLLALILQKTRYVTGADAGSVYVVEGDDEDDIERRTLRFKVSQNDSVRLDFTEFTLPVSKTSIVGRCVIHRAPINIDDLYRMDQPGDGNNPMGLRHNREFDEKTGYQTRSMLTVPMVDAHQQVIGVIQLINKKRRPEASLRRPEDFDRQVVPFDRASQDLAEAVASQAAISLENAKLLTDIQGLFEGFVDASVKAIEARDPTTSGHSRRVSDLTVALAKATDSISQGPYADYRADRDEIKRIEYAARLHDFGKVGVREHVLVKAKKLYEHERELILARFDYIRKSIDAEYSQRKLQHALAASGDDLIQRLELVDDEFASRLAEIDDYVKFILKANEPTVLEEGGFERLADLAHRTYRDRQGQELPYLKTDEVKALQILRGSLTPEERIEIESHVKHTINFLNEIPWGRLFRDVPRIAGAHHEKLDGTGYPGKLRSERIPTPSKMMMISDIYDALSASDRPYKKAVPVDKALDIIASEVKAGKCDPELFRIFVDAKIFQVVTPR